MAKTGHWLYWQTFEKEAWNPVTNMPVTAQRRRLKVDFDLPMRDQHSEFIRNLFTQFEQGS